MRVLLWAYVRGNLGDDLFIKMICKRYPKTTFYVIGYKKYRHYLVDIDNLRYISHDLPFIKFISRVLKVINFILGTRLDRIFSLNYLIKGLVNHTVYIGGSIFIQDGDWQSRLRGDKLLVDQNTSIIGCNFGPYIDSDFLSSYREVFMSAKEVCFRDKNSYDKFADLDNTHYAMDIVFGLENATERDKQDDYIIISIIYPEVKTKMIDFQKNYFDVLINAAKILSDDGFRVSIMTFCNEEGDLRAARILDGLSEGTFYEVYEHKNIEESINYISNSSGIIATRFHAMILGWVLQLPTYPIVYSDKMSNVISDVVGDSKYSRIEDLSEIAVNDMINEIRCGASHDLISNSSDEHFSRLDKILLR